MTSPSFEALFDHLWSAPEGAAPPNVYALLDGARDPQVFPLVTGCNLATACLYTGRLPKELLEVAPYLIHLTPKAAFTRELLERSWSRSWGVFLVSRYGLEDVRRHLKRFLRVADERGKTFVFRYYDPRILRVYLPTCTAEELKGFFGPIDRYCMEAEEPRLLLDFSLEGGGLREARVPVL